MTIQARQEELSRFMAFFFPEDVGSDASTDDDPAVGNYLTDTQAVEWCRRSRDGQKFDKLYDYPGGKWPEGYLGYPSQSEADCALCGMLAWPTNRDTEAIDRIFRESGLYRKKWDRADYRERTIRKALSGKKGGFGAEPAVEQADAGQPAERQGADQGAGAPWGWAKTTRGRAITATAVSEPDYLVRGMFSRGRQHAIIGPSGSGKSWVEFDLCVCVACDEVDTFLGQQVVMHGPVLIESWEQGEQEDRRRVQKLLRGHGISEAPDSLILASEPLLTLNDEGAYRARLRDILAARVVLYAFDSLSEGSGIDLNDNAAYTAWHRDRVDPLLRAGVTVVFTHLRGHISAQRGALADRDAAFRGATQIRALSTGVVECRSVTDDSWKLIHNKHRDTPALPLGTLRLAGGFEDPDVQLKMVQALAPADVKDFKMKQVLLWLQSRPRSSKTKIKEGVGYGWKTITDALEEAKKLQLVLSAKNGEDEVYSTPPGWLERYERDFSNSPEDSDD